jgi:hypothetical protein
MNAAQSPGNGLQALEANLSLSLASNAHSKCAVGSQTQQLLSRSGSTEPASFPCLLLLLQHPRQVRAIRARTKAAIMPPIFGGPTATLRKAPVFNPMPITRWIYRSEGKVYSSFRVEGTSDISFMPWTYIRQDPSVLSFAFASAVVCHCILEGASGPPHSSGFTWSTI